MSGGAKRDHRAIALGLALALPVLALPVLGLTGCGAKADDKARVTPSGLPVPRYVSLKFDPVNARSGPSDDHRLLWVYHARGLPVQIVAETTEWRRICDPDGGLSWVHRRVTDGRRTVMQEGQSPLPLRAKPRADSAIVAYLAPRAVAGFDRCQKGWCRVRAGSADGWAPSNTLWGTADAVQCPKSQAATPPPSSTAP
jgi:SH3-like domain-containing protein